MTTTYKNIEDNWILGLPVSRTVKSTRGAADKSRTTGYFYYSDEKHAFYKKGVLKTRTIEREDKKVSFTAFGHDSLGNVTSIGEEGETVDGRQHRTTSIAYDSNKVLPVSVTDDYGHTVDLGYDRGLGMLLHTSDPALPNDQTIETFIIPDGFGRPRYQVDGADVRSQLDYARGAVQATSVVVTIRDEGQLNVDKTVWSRKTVVTHDLHGRPTLTTASGNSASRVRQEAEYDDFGRLEHISRFFKKGKTPVFTSLN